MTRNDTSIVQDMEIIKRKTDEFRFNGTCETCGSKLFFEAGWHGTDDEPPSRSFYYCETCGEVEDD